MHFSKLHDFCELPYLEHTKSRNDIERLYTPKHQYTDAEAHFQSLYIHSHITLVHANYEFATQGPIRRPKRMISSFCCATLRMESWVFSTSNVEQISSLRYTFASSLSFLLLIYFLSRRDQSGTMAFNGMYRI